MKLYVIRHSDAGDPSVDPKEERERGLTASGRKLTEAVGQAMLEADEVPRVLFASPFARTVQTADILGKMFEVSVNIVGDFSPDRPLESSILEFMGHDELRRFGIVVHSDNSTPAFNKFGGDMGEWTRDSDELDDKNLWPKLVKGEVRRLRIHREFGFWQCQWRLLPSDIGFDDEDD